MPFALLVTDEKTRDPAIILKMLEHKGIIKRISVLGVNVWARHTMRKDRIRECYKKEKEKITPFGFL